MLRVGFWRNYELTELYIADWKPTGTPVEVGITMYVLSISSLSEVKMVLDYLTLLLLLLILIINS